MVSHATRLGHHLEPRWPLGVADGLDDRTRVKMYKGAVRLTRERLHHFNIRRAVE